MTPVFVALIILFGPWLVGVAIGRLLEGFFPPKPVEMIKVVDGDSVMINQIKCRLYGIDAPEWNQPFGRGARDLLFRLTQNNRPLTYRIRGRDKYGRRLVVIYGKNGLDLNAAMVEAGFAIAYARYSRSYRSLERTARRKELGIWSGPGFVHPEIFRHATSK